MTAAGETQAILPENEPERLAAVHRYDVLDTPRDGAFDRITALAARHFDVPISIVSVVDSDRIWFKSHHGLDVTQVDRDPGLCASAILHGDPWIVEDAAVDPRTLANPLVAGEFGLRFYAGAPLTTRDGYNLGTLCLLDVEPRQLTDEEVETLRDMAAIVMDELELRLASRRIVDREQTLRDGAQQMAGSLQQSLLPPRLAHIPGAELAPLYLPASSSEVGGDFYDVFEIDGGWALVIGDVSGKGADAASVTALARHTIRTGFLATTDPTEVLTTLNRAMFLGLDGEDPRHFCTVLVITVRPSAAGFVLSVATAGHPPALRLREGSLVSPLEGPGGPPVGWHLDAEFSCWEEELRPSDALILYTDGVSEARRAGELIGEDGVVAILEELGHAGAEQIVARLSAALRAEDIEVRDDAAALVMRVRSERAT